MAIDKKIIRLAIDGNEANVERRVGSNFYAFELLRAMKRVGERQQKWRVTVLLAKPPIADLPPESRDWRYRIVGPKAFWTQWALSWHLFWRRRDYDVFFTPGHYAPRLSFVPYISSVMDLAFLYFPEQFRSKDRWQLTEWTRYSVAKAVKVLTISRATQKDVCREYQKSKAQTFVAYPALGPRIRLTAIDKKRLAEKLPLSKPYFLYLGTLQPRKNLLKLIQAFEQVKRYLQAQQGDARLRRWQKLQLLIAGKIGWLADDILAAAKQSPFSDSIHLLGYVDEKSKQYLLMNAEALILVGFYEGFGIPPLEAMRYQTISIVSNRSSLPEVVGPAGILVRPDRVGQIARAMKKVINMKTMEKRRYRQLMKEQIERFSWTKSAELVLKQLAEVAGAKQ